jgi:hypothetical protein
LYKWLTPEGDVRILKLYKPYTPGTEAMTKHTLDSTHIVKADLERVWDFFSRARNLGRITPARWASTSTRPTR